MNRCPVPQQWRWHIHRCDLAAGIKDPGYYGFGVLFADFDNDGWPDIYVANDSQPNLLFHNKRNGTFAEIGLLSGTALSDVRARTIRNGCGYRRL